MRLYPFKIFSLSKNKRLFNKHEPHRTIGLYDVEKMNYSEAVRQSKFVKDCKVSILLGSVIPKVNLIVLDLDDCFDNEGFLEPDTEKFLKEFNVDEWEVSSSGTGIHIYILTKLNLETFIVKDLEGCKSFECYTNKRHIVTTTFDFLGTNLLVGAHDDFIKTLYDKVKQIQEAKNPSSYKDTVIAMFNGREIKEDTEIYADRTTLKDRERTKLNPDGSVALDSNGKEIIEKYQATDYDEVVLVNPFTGEITPSAEWQFNADEDIFGKLEENNLAYVSMKTHHGIWSYIEDVTPDEIQNKKGMQQYLKYCKDNNITKDKIEEETHLGNLSDVMKYYKPLDKEVR